MGTFVFTAGKPTGISKKAFSPFGLFKISSKNPIGEGVWVSVAKPELCRAASKIPHAIPTDSFT